MSTEEITEVLNAAVIKNRFVSIQKEKRDPEGYYPDDIIGKIIDIGELGIYVDKNKVDIQFTLTFFILKYNLFFMYY